MKDIYPTPPSSLKDFENALQEDKVDVIIMTTCEYDSSFDDQGLIDEATQNSGSTGSSCVIS